MKLTFYSLPPDVHDLDEHGNDAFWSLPAEDRKAYCRAYASRLIQSGRVTRQPCCVCRQPNGQAHHDNYDRPYEVAWLCRLHHSEREREINQAMPPFSRRVTVLPPLPNERGISRQILLIAHRRKNGLCSRCGKPAATKSHCLPHAIEAREKARARRAKQLGRELRQNKSLTRHLEEQLSQKEAA